MISALLCSQSCRQPCIGHNRSRSATERQTRRCFWMRLTPTRPIPDPSLTARLGSDFAWRDPRIDALIDSYVEWREECEAVEAAYRRWTGSARSERDLAFSAYRAALDREEKGASVYALVAARLVSLQRE
jgi:hypothetical protein